MYFVDRSVAVIKPKQPFLDWLNQAPDNDMDLALDSLRADCTVILLPEFDEPEEGVAYIDEIYEQLFKMELASWYEDEETWPKDLSLKAFWEWFDVEIHSTVIDSVDADISNNPALDL
ncbi:hypothetical protein HA052_06895 [Chromobacterium haemolyticum]|uniref:VacJ n=1 Tax=Chromobacterium fluminis TaxID=3044269 RepID=A0ABX0LC35_9NEIS|nr:hypothetical protein [Chromobacterium haemolyticum]NHR04922.1 hypothetical protein [Chromobacterium haemolyticum]OQS34035.1 hypothetical protein B0T39_20085 [Chromobacterium haemolyticum]